MLVENENNFDQILGHCLDESVKIDKIDDPVVFLKSFFKTKEFKPKKRKFRPPK